MDKKRRMIRVGLDFDGVVAYNPFRVIRAPVKWFKSEVLGIKKLSFFVPKNRWERVMWIIVHESSVVPAQGVTLLKQMAENNEIEVHLVTARFGFLKNNLEKWLEKNELKKVFKTVNINEKCEQPHVYKQRIVEKLKLDVFVEDNLDIVLHLSGKGQKLRTKIFWIYNILDSKKNYPYKFPYLEKALKEISEHEDLV